MIEIKNLYKRYHNHHGSDWVLKDINLTIPSGVSVGLIGANGAGKSTLLRLIAGMDTPDRGEVIRHSRVSWPVGLAGGMQNNMTGRQNAKFVARAQGCGPAEVNRVIEFVQDFAEIGEAFDEPVRTYSSGMRSRLSFGLSLSFEFDIYISDEATAVGDRSFRAKAQQLFKDKVGKASLIMVSHGESILRDLCQVGVYIRKSEAFWFEDINEAIACYHADVDGLSKLNPDQGEGDGSANNYRSQKEQFDELQKELKKAKQFASGIGIKLKQAKKESWKSFEVAFLNKVHKAALSDVDVLYRKFSSFEEGERQAFKAKIKRAEQSLESFYFLSEKAISEGWGVDEQEVLKKVIRISRLQKEEAEKLLEKIDGSD